MMLKAINITQQISGKTILKDCCLRLKPGRFTAIVGPNGAGKSTLLKAISGESRKFKGEVILNGKQLQCFKPRELSVKRAILPQHTVVNFPFTVEQVIEIGRYAHRTTAVENEIIINSVMRMTDLKKFKGRAYQTLSGGEKQRVQMARVMAQIRNKTSDPKYVLLDEPTASLDIAQQHTILSLAKNLCNENIAVMAVLHDLNLAIQYADDILFLKNGQTVAYGELKDVVTKDIIEKTFGYPVRLLEDDGELIVVPNKKSNSDKGTSPGKKLTGSLKSEVLKFNGQPVINS
ncbi:MAG: heme ABC transporter ATP-binding protein [Candidatus Cyclobacteriaceae bacterium M2_1C_046]